MSSSVGHVPAKPRWEFDASVTDAFDDMLERSIPQYEQMRRTVGALAMEFAERHIGPVTDLGSSRGEALTPIVERLGSARRYFAIEHSPPMVKVLEQRFKQPISEGWFHVLDDDLRRPSRRWGVGGSVTLSVLTLQFVPINYRQGLIREVAFRLAPTGAFLMVEKVLGESYELDELMVAHYHALKGANGYGQEEIERKRMALEGVLVPVTARWNEDLLRQGGFRHVDCIWRCLNFAAWLAMK